MTPQRLTRHPGLVTSLSWIPTEAIEGAQRLAFDSGITHYDPPPPTDGMDAERLRDEDRFRFATRLGAFITVDDGRIVDCGYEGGGLMGTTLVHLGAVRHRFQAVQLPDLVRGEEQVVLDLGHLGCDALQFGGQGQRFVGLCCAGEDFSGLDFAQRRQDSALERI